MFRIPSFYEMPEMTFDEATQLIERLTDGGLLEGMEFMNKQWDKYLAEERAFLKGETDEKTYGDDDDFYDHWQYEVNAFNVVFENMSKLFAPKETV